MVTKISLFKLEMIRSCSLHGSWMCPKEIIADKVSTWSVAGYSRTAFVGEILEFMILGLEGLHWRRDICSVK